MSPRLDARGFSSRDSRKRHCGRGVVPPFGRLTFPRSGHLTSTSLLPFAPPRFAARLPRYYESSDSVEPLHPTSPVSPGSSPSAILRRGPGPLFTQRPPLRLTMRRPRPSPDRSPCLSRLTAASPSPTTACHFVTVALTRYFTAVTPRLSPRADRSGRREGRRAVKRSDTPRSLPDRLGRIEFTCVTDGSFVSGCSPPFLMETQLPLSTSGR